METTSIRLTIRNLPDHFERTRIATVLDEIEMVVTHGVLQHLLVMPNKSWTDRELAQYHARQYTYKTSSRRAKANLGVGRGPLRAKMQPFGG